MGLGRCKRADRPSNALGELGIAPQPLRGAVAQCVRHTAPGQGDADIRQRQRLRAKAPLVIIIADREVEVAHPTIITECGRAIVAYHSVLVFNVLGVAGMGEVDVPPELPADAEQPLIDLSETYRGLTAKNLLANMMEADLKFSDSQIGFLQEILRWWDHWLKGIDTGVMDEPMLRAWMTDSVKPASHHDTLPGRWIAESSWPPPGIKPRRLFLTDAGLRDAAAPLTARAALARFRRWPRSRRRSASSRAARSR